MPYKYTAIPVAAIPYPEGLGKNDHKALEQEMERLLGPRQYRDADSNEKLFWTDRYQQLIADHLAPVFDPTGPIVDIATAALELARTSPGFDREIPGEDFYGAHGAHLPKSSDADDRLTQRVRSWASFPPELWPDRDRPGRWCIGDGRHRLSYLRHRIQQQDPQFPVLVRFGWE